MKASDIIYVLENLGGDSFRQSGNNVMTNCVMAPWTHQSGRDTTRKMGVLVQDGPALVHCFYPGCFHGTLMDLVTEVGGRKVAAGEMTMEEVSNLKAFIIMAEEEEVEPQFTVQRPKQPVPGFLMNALGTGSPYFRSRGIGDEVEKEWRLGEFGGRALIPFIDQKGDVVAVHGRLLPGRAEDDYGDGRKAVDAKYRTDPFGFEKAEFLFGEHLLTKPVDFMVVVESPVDALMLNEWLRSPESVQVLPYANATEGAVAVATMGAEPSKTQVQKIVDGVSKQGVVVVGYDADHAGRLGARKLVEAIRFRLPRVEEVEWQGKDPSDDNDGKLSLDEVKKRALDALGQRTDWFDRWLRRALTNTV